MMVMIELARLGSACIALLLSRWLLDLSTPEKDLSWLRLRLRRIKRFVLWWGGSEVIHQLRARKLLAYV